MALMQIKIRKRIDMARAELAELDGKRAAYNTRAEELEAAMSEAATEADVDLVSADVDALESEITANDEAREALEAKISALESELAELDAKHEAATRNAATKTTEKRGDTMGYYEGMTADERRHIRRPSVRREIAELMRNDEVRGFYGAMRDHMLKTRALTNTELTIPDVVLDRIQQAMGDYGVMPALVETVRVSGELQVVMDGGNPEGIWTDMCDPVQELAGAFIAIDFQGYKVSGFIPVCNAILEDSMINLAAYVEMKLARAIARALDKAIITGPAITDASRKQPAGIKPNLAAANIVTLTEKEIEADLFRAIALVDNGEDSTGELVAVMKRSTYYAEVIPRLMLANSGGTYTVPSVTSPNMLGFRVVFSQYMADGEVLIGDYKRYMLVERAGTKVTVSTDVRFIEDQTVFKATARYDGKPVRLDDQQKTHDWVLVKFPARTPAGE